VPTDSTGLSYQLLDKIGNWGSDTGLFFFENVRVPVTNTIGDIGRGVQQQSSAWWRASARTRGAGRRHEGPLSRKVTERVFIRRVSALRRESGHRRRALE
jgi:hypothetical protein